MSVLAVPGARLYYESVGSGPPLVLIPGGNGTAHIFGPVAQHLAQRFTVTTYDRRGFARSQLDGVQDYRCRLQTDADDALKVIELVATAPATVYGPSSGAVVGLQALTQHPSLIDRIVAYEPPAMKQLPDGQRWLELCDKVYDIYRQSGIPPALDLFNNEIFPPQDVAFMARLRDISQPAVRAAVVYWFEHELRQYTAVDLAIDTLSAHASRIAVATGRDSRGYPLHDVCTNLAKALGQTLTELPGGHTGYATHAAEFAAALLDLLAPIEVRS
jgi:acetyltransferase/esterase